MSPSPIDNSTFLRSGDLRKLLSRDVELSRQVAAQSRLEGLLYAVRRAVAAGDVAALPGLADEARRISGDFAAACGDKPDRNAQAVIALGRTVQSLCERSRNPGET
jgi:hypothetical protein